MNRKILHQYVLSLVPMSPEKTALVVEGFDYFELAKQDLLLKEGKVSHATYFLEEGIIRSYTFDNEGAEVTTNIFTAPCFVNDFLSFFKQQPTQENFQAITSCKLWTMDFAKVQYYFHSYPEFREFGRMMLVSNYASLHNRMLGMIKDTAETRYVKLMLEHPQVFQHVPLRIIASFLGITDTSLSRIRRELIQK